MPPRWVSITVAAWLVLGLVLLLLVKLSFH